MYFYHSNKLAHTWNYLKSVQIKKRRKNICLYLSCILYRYSRVVSRYNYCTKYIFVNENNKSSNIFSVWFGSFRYLQAG